jgi:hypothetical protein
MSSPINDFAPFQLSSLFVIYVLMTEKTATFFKYIKKNAGIPFTTPEIEMHAPTSHVGNKPTTSILSSWVWA